MSDRTALLVIDMQIGLVEGDLIGRAGTQTEFCVDTTCRCGDVTFGYPSAP
jgi:nicotinamidase-related amidase